MQPSRSWLALIGMALAFAALLANALIGYLDLRRLYVNEQTVNRTYETILAIHNLNVNLTDLEAVQREYAATGDTSDLTQFEHAVRQVGTALQRLTSQVGDDPRRAPALAELELQAGRKLGALRELVAGLPGSGSAVAPEALVTESRQATTALRETVARMEAGERRLLADRQDQSRVSYWRALASGVIVGVIGVGLSLVAALLVWRDFAARGKYAAHLRSVNGQLAQQAEQLARFNESLAAEVAERKRVETALHAADQHKDQFLAMLAHELRNPLSPLMSAAQLLALQPGATPESKETTAIMLRQIEQLTRLIDDLLDVSRISRGKLQLQLEPTQLGDAISAALDVSRPLIEAKQHELRVTLPEEPVVFLGDKVRLAQIIGNLLINAAKYTPPHGRIELDVQASNEQAIVRVSDNGIGIAAETLPRIFGLFTQADTPNVRSQGGLGIGLSLAKSLVELHGGAIRADSAGLGKGSQFVVSFPLATAPRRAAADGPPAPEHVDLQGVRFLIVDDNPSASHLLSRLLGKLGQEVQSASSALAALELVAKWQPHVVISDIGMPDVSGYELAARIDGLPGQRRPMLIALTGYGQTSDRQAALAAGFDEHLTKPIGMPALRALLNRVALWLSTRPDSPPLHEAQVEAAVSSADIVQQMQSSDR